MQELVPLLYNTPYTGDLGGGRGDAVAMTDTPKDGGVGQLSSTIVALNDLPTHVSGGYTVDGDKPVLISEN